jgi:sulfate adenylyltransferase
MRCYNAVMARYPPGSAVMTLSSVAGRASGARAALWRAIVGRNFGCTHWMIGNEDGDLASHSGQGAEAAAASSRAVLRHAGELGVAVVPFPGMAYCDERGCYVPEHERLSGEPARQLSAAEVRGLLQRGQEIPDWFTFPEVAAELRRTYRPPHERGLTVFFTGLSGSGKSTLANALLVKLLETGDRTVTLLDGDLVRKHLTSELGFSREHRSLNVKRIGYVAAEVTRSGGVAICALIAPHEFSRHDVRQMVEPLGGFVLVHVSTPLAVCEARDRKGLYAKARAGLVAEFTGISAPYEAPADADLTIDTSVHGVAAAVAMIMQFLRTSGYLAPPGADATARVNG